MVHLDRSNLMGPSHGRTSDGRRRVHADDELKTVVVQAFKGLTWADPNVKLARVDLRVEPTSVRSGVARVIGWSRACRLGRGLARLGIQDAAKPFQLVLIRN